MKVAEHLAQSLQECSRVQEIIQCSGIVGNDGGTSEVVVHEFQIELEQLQSKLDHLKAQVGVLQFSPSCRPGRCPEIPEILKFVLKCPEIGVRS